MTTVIYKDGLVAVDGRVSSITDGTIFSDKYIKLKEQGGVYFFFLGSLSSLEKIMRAYLTNQIELPIDANAVVVDQDKMFYIGINPNQNNTDIEGPYLWKDPIDLGIPTAYGSGADHALTAMDLGLSAEEALKMVMKRDTGTNGLITIFDVKSKKIVKQLKPVTSWELVQEGTEAP